MLKKFQKILFLFLFLFVFSCDKKNNEDNNAVSFVCSAEFLSKDSTSLYESNYKLFFKGLNYRTDSISHSGKYSLLLDSTKIYAFTVETTNFTYDESYELSVWKFGASDLAVVVSLDSGYYESSKEIIATNDDWEKVVLSFSIPPSYRGERLKMYVWNIGKQNVFVDDFKLVKKSAPVFSSNDTAISLFIDKPEYNKIKNIRDKALEKGLLITNDDSWVKSFMFFGDNSYKLKIRLKGDWLDHLRGSKWSYRIKIKTDDSFKGIRTFSIQDPKTRYFMHEWLMHKVFRDEGIISPKYGFVPVKINDNWAGIYAYEEHFEKQIVESQKRREGPILKFDDFAYWYDVLLTKQGIIDNHYLTYEPSIIVPFKQSKTIKNQSLFTQFNIAKNLVYQHKYFLTPASELFDIELLAKYYAMITVQKLYHGSLWINQRFYYNPITSKLEMIAYDSFTESGAFDYINRTIYGNFNVNNSKNKLPSEKIHLYLFTDTVFVNKYIDYMQIYSQKSYWDSVFVKYEKEIKKNENLLRQEYSNYQFDKNYFYSNAENIRNSLPEYVEKVKNGLYNNLEIKNSSHTTVLKPNLLIASSLVQVYTQRITDFQSDIKILNYNPVQISVIGYFANGVKNSTSTNIIDNFSPDNQNWIKTISIESKIIDSLILKIDGLDKTIAVSVLPWSAPSVWTPRQELESNNKFPNETYYSVEDNNVIFKGIQKIREIVLIPKNYNVIFESGAEIDFVNGGAFLSYSPVYINGTKEKPVKIFSSDKSGRGFTVLQGKTVEMNYAIFDGLNTFSYKGWGLSGAVSIYECNTKISNCKFINNQCEDDLNIIRSYFDVSNCLFKNTFSDAFDSDFCTGKADNCKFDKLGNDAIDFSTSDIEITNCTIKNAIDKGVSGGEASHLTIKNCTIDGANIAIAAKDKTVLNISNVEIKNVTYVLAAFKKKPEYGAANIIADDIEAENYVQFSLIEKKSSLILDGLKIEGQYKDVAKKFY